MWEAQLRDRMRWDLDLVSGLTELVVEDVSDPTVYSSLDCDQPVTSSIQRQQTGELADRYRRRYIYLTDNNGIFKLATAIDVEAVNFFSQRIDHQIASLNELAAKLRCAKSQLRQSIEQSIIQTVANSSESGDPYDAVSLQTEAELLNDSNSYWLLPIGNQQVLDLASWRISTRCPRHNLSSTSDFTYNTGLTDVTAGVSSVISSST